jgi:AraC-like DNA-binding protein
MNMMKNHPHRQIQLKYIAETCGFKSMSAFSNLFKQTYGKTPTEWLNHPSPTAKKKDG